MQDGRGGFVYKFADCLRRLGLNLNQPKGAYDASRFDGISFYARRSAGSSARVRVHFPDWNTNPDGRVCSECFNDFGQDIVLTTEWTKVHVSVRCASQLPGWGAPRPNRLETEKLSGSSSG